MSIVDPFHFIRTDSIRLDEKTDFFSTGFASIDAKLSDRWYTSVATFSAEIGSVLITALAHTDAQIAGETRSDITEMHNQYGGRLTLEQRQAMTAEQKQRQTVAKRIIRAIKEPLEDALKKEAQLKGISYNKDLKALANIDAQLDGTASQASPEKSTAHSLVNGDSDNRRPSDISAIAGASPSGTNEDMTMTEAPPVHEEDIKINGRTSPKKRKASMISATSGGKDAQPTQAPSPPISSSSQNAIDRIPSISSASTGSSAPIADTLSNGGVPWYMRPFDPIGTTIHDEEASTQAPTADGDLSDELSDMDDEELKKLARRSVSKPAAASVKTPAKRGRGASRGRARGGRRSTTRSGATPVVEEEQTSNIDGEDKAEAAPASAEKDTTAAPEATPIKPKTQRRKSNRGAAKDVDATSTNGQGTDEVKDGDGEEKTKDGDSREAEKQRVKRASMDAYNERRRLARVAEREKKEKNAKEG